MKTLFKSLVTLLLLAQPTLMLATQPNDVERDKRPGCSQLLP